MNFMQALIEALESLTANKLRSGLTILGIVIGVGAVVAMLAVGQGAQNSILGSISGAGSNLIIVMPGNSSNSEVRTIKPLTMADAKALKDTLSVPSAQVVAPVIAGRAQVTAGGNNTSTTIDGVTPEFQEARNYMLSDGDFLNAENVNGRASVAIIGVEVADKLFDSRENVIGKTVRIEGQPFRVIGLLVEKGGGPMGSQDDVILVPITTAQTRILRRDSDEVDQIYISAVDSDSVTQASEEISNVLRNRHRTDFGEDDFTIFTQQDIASAASSVTGILTVFLGGIAAISLLVGGIGIMNIMLVSVTERTREIGLRKALGARKRDILMQFLTESSILSLIGGVIGILLGWTIGFAVSQVAAASGTPLNAAVTPDSVLLAVSFSTAIGLFFGIYPANRAAGLEPVEALRYE